MEKRSQNNVLTLTILLFVFLFFTGCGTFAKVTPAGPKMEQKLSEPSAIIPTGPPINFERYFKLVSGKKSIYQMKSKAGSHKSEGKMVITTLDARELNSKRVIPLKYDSDIGGDKSMSLAFLAEENDGLYQIGRQMQEMTAPEIITPPDCWAKNPLRVGSIWDIQVRAFMLGRLEGPGKAVVEKDNDNVLTLAGEFKDCVRIVYKGVLKKENNTVSIEATEWFAPDLGSIKQIHKEKGIRGSEAILSLELISYE